MAPGSPLGGCPRSDQKAMLFNSFEYLLFLVLVFIAFWALARYKMLRVVLLLLSSYIFYMAWNATFIVLIIASTLADYFCGLGLGKAEKPIARKALLVTSLVFNLGLLGLFKYADFFIGATADTLGLVGIHITPHYLNFILPVGISFYTFQSLSYTIDVYRRKIEPTKSIIEFATYVAFFPQLVAGPIVRAKEFLPQFRRPPKLTKTQANEALFLIITGMFKKVMIADYLAANYLDRVYDNPLAYSSAECWLALYGYSWQLYGDFSGYTDIARGSAKLFGFELPENFYRPWAATGPIEFWRTWHVTLGRWVQDYIYVSFGGSRHGLTRTWANMWGALFIMGVWHGAGWGYVLFALWHATGATLNRIYRDVRGIKERPPFGLKAVVLAALFQLFFMASWIPFRPASAQQSFDLMDQLMAGELWPIRISLWSWTLLIALPIIHFTPMSWVDDMRRAFVRTPTPIKLALILALAALIMHVGSQQPAPFIYFQF